MNDYGLNGSGILQVRSATPELKLQALESGPVRLHWPNRNANEANNAPTELHFHTYDIASKGHSSLVLRS